MRADAAWCGAAREVCTVSRGSGRALEIAEMYKIKCCPRRGVSAPSYPKNRRPLFAMARGGALSHVATFTKVVKFEN